MPYLESPRRRCTKIGTALSDGMATQTQPYRLVVLALAYCGLRWGELAALKVSSVDVKRRRIEVRESVVEDGGALSGGPRRRTSAGQYQCRSSRLRT